MPKKPIYDEETGKPTRDLINRLAGAKQVRDAGEKLRAAAKPSEPLRPVIPPQGSAEAPPLPAPEDVIDDREVHDMRRTVADVEDAATKQDRLDKNQYLTVRIRTRDGNSFGLPYAYMIEVNEVAAPEYYIEMLFSSRKVIIKGRNLEKLYEALLGYNVAEIAESLSDFDDSAEHEVFVSSIVTVEL